MAGLGFIFESDSKTHSCLAHLTATKEHEKMRLGTNKMIIVGRSTQNSQQGWGNSLLGQVAPYFFLN